MNSRLTPLPGYHLTEKIYEGSRTLVYRGEKAASGQAVIVKLMRPEHPSFRELVQFRNQYTITQNLDFEGIVKTVALERYENRYALVMTDTESISLTQYQQQYSLSIPQFLTLAIQIAEVLHQLHKNSIIHKDIKPANILIHPQTKKVKLIDFSISTLLPKETQTLQTPNVLEGTLAYLSPEQTGRMNRGIDYRSDFYSLGITFYELLTGTLPFQKDDPLELIHCHIAESPQTLGDNCPPILSEIVLKLMAKNAEDRYQSALGLKRDLEKCLSQYQENGEIEPFVLGERDLCDRFIIPEKLYGRETEVETLLQAFHRVAEGNSEMMLVAGFSGIGKTAVVNEVHKPIVKQRGYFIKGKFDQFKRNIPLSAFLQAFRDLIRQLLTESDAQIQAWKNQILAAVGENGQVIIEVIPELEKIIGKQPPVVELSGTAAQNRFNLLFQKFTQVFTCKAYPLVIFLDDLQWADIASLKLIQMLMADTRYLLLIGAYRDNEVNLAHPLMLALGEMQKSGFTTNTITLKPLNPSQINQLVADTLKSTLEVAIPLSELVFQKTQGNPFFATQFLKALYEENAIAFNLQGGYWQCDITTIKKQALSEDVVEFMALQLEKLPLVTQNILKLAACIGNQFDLATLAIVSEQSESEAADHLWKGLQEGLILPISEIYKLYLGQGISTNTPENPQNVTYKFLHDRVQQAAYSLIPDSEKQKTHYRIGQLLLQTILPETREEHIFELVNQLNYGTALITAQKEKDELSQLNAIACRKARNSTAYQVGREYAKIGLSLLGKKAWSRKYDQTLEFHELAAELALLCGDFAEMDRFVEIACDRANSLVEKVKVYRLKIQACFAQNQLTEAVNIALDLLQKLGVTFPESPTQNDIQQALTEIHQLIGDREIEDLVHLPKMTDAEKIAIVKIANSIMPAAYFIGSPIHPLLITLAVKESILLGNTPASAYSYSAYAFMTCNPLQDVDTGVKFGRLALHIASQPDAKAVQPSVLTVVGALIVYRTSHAKDCLPLLQEGYATALEVGDPDTAGHNAHNFCLNSFWYGRPLLTLEKETNAYCNGLLQLKQSTTANYCRIYWQGMLNLLGETEKPTVLSGKAFEEATSLPQLLEARDLFAIYISSAFKLMLCYLFGELEAAKKSALEVEKYFTVGLGTLAEPAFYFYDSLTILAALNSELEPSSTDLEKVEQNQKKLQQQWANYAPMNHQHKVDLVEAEKCRVLKQKVAASELYDKAITGAKENEYIQEEALANELAAKFYLDWGRLRLAQDYLIEAYYCYARWGAKAKVADLEQRYPQLLAPILQPNRSSLSTHETILAAGTVTSPSTSSGRISVALDLAAILKASQALSSEIKLDKLLSSLLSIIIENAGADKCVLMLSQHHPPRNSQDERLLIKGLITLGTEPVVLQRLPIEQSQDVPLNLIYKVKHNRQTEVLSDARVETTLAHDAYIQQHQPQSVLCSPILHQGKLMGIIYLENNLTTGAFTRDRVELLSLLCAQAAISLENTRLYENVSQYAQQLEQTLENLQNTQLQLVQSEKMSALGNLVAGIAHEMNNPLGFLAASLQQTQPTFDELVEHLRLYQETFPDASEEILDHAEEIDLDYTLEDLPKMFNSLVMACDRLKNISTSLRIFSRADKDYKVPFDIHQGIDSTLLILKHRLKANEQRPEIEVVTHYGNLPKIECFPGQLNQVFMNIIANAIDALDENICGKSYREIKQHPNVITIETTAIANYQVQVRIQDNGCGMKPETVERIFEQGFTTKEVGKGTGLGMAIAQQIVTEKHGGKIVVNSRLGEGTEFIITLPIEG